jgi:phosphate/phosphite/phosphonate ABC transporter binding protein
VKRLLLLLSLSCSVQPPDPGPLVMEEVPAPPPVELVDVPNPLVLGLLPVFAPDQMVRQFSPFASYLGEQLDTTVELRLSESYDEMVSLLDKGEVDLAQLSPFVYVTAKEKVPEIELIATNIAEGSSTYSGYIVARTDLGVSSIDDLKGLRFGFVDQHSASGHLYPSAFLISGGLEPQRDFREIVFAGRHDSLLNYLISGRIDAGATFSGALLNAEGQGLDVEQIEIVAKTGRIPYDAWVTRGDLHPSVVSQLESSLLALSTRDKKGRRILGPLRSINAFAPVTDAHYDQVRAVKLALERVRK